MAYFLVFQNEFYEEESKGGYLWTTNAAKEGQEHFSGSNLKKIQPGDCIFSVVDGYIVSMNLAREFYKEEVREKEGCILPAKYQELKKPISLSEYMDQLLPLSQKKDGPFTEDGKVRPDYLFPISNTMGKFIRSIVEHQNAIETPILRNAKNTLIEEKEERLLAKMKARLRKKGK